MPRQKLYSHDTATNARLYPFCSLESGTVALQQRTKMLANMRKGCISSSSCRLDTAIICIVIVVLLTVLPVPDEYQLETSYMSKHVDMHQLMYGSSIYTH
jgi:hypothetical protein